MHVVARVAKEVKFHLCQPEQGISKQFNNKFSYILEVFSWCFTKFKVKKYKQKTKSKTEKAQTKRKTIFMWLLSALFDVIRPAAGSVNCTCTDRVTSSRYHGHFAVSLSAKRNGFFY